MISTSTPISSLSDRIHDEIDPKQTERRLILRQLHDAAQLGDVDTVKSVFDTDTGIPIDTTRKGRNTTLHTALLHNQEGMLIDYLIQKGADVNAENTKGYCPLTLAIIHCKGSKAVEKLIAAGARWGDFDSGAFVGLSARDVAIKYDNKKVVDLFKSLEENMFCKEVTTSEPRVRMDRKNCPICNLLVKFPTKMSRIESDQESIEKRVHNNGEMYGEGKHQQKKFISRKYMDQLLAHSNGEA